MPDIIQYEFNISMRLMKDFLESESAWPLIEGMARSCALVRSLLLAWLIGGNRWCRVCPGFLNISPNIRSSAESQIWANAGWVFGKKPSFIAFFSTPSSLLRPCASSRPHHAWDAYVSLAMKVARVTSHRWNSHRGNSTNRRPSAGTG